MDNLAHEMAAFRQDLKAFELRFSAELARHTKAILEQLDIVITMVATGRAPPRGDARKVTS
ncbi:MAG: hypothetical protein H0T46_28085 [Deltaproteobacteria bacterium]|nr:hypothetical protein [Deltaproteobacteria bacterium]